MILDESLRTFSWKLAYLSLVCCSLETFWNRFARRVEVTVKVFLPSVFETSIHQPVSHPKLSSDSEPHCRICAFLRFCQILNTLCNFSLFFRTANRTCSSDEFRCGNGKCTKMNWRCDGVNDCEDFSDEIACPTKSTRKSNHKKICQNFGILHTELFMNICRKYFLYLI